MKNDVIMSELVNIKKVFANRLQVPSRQKKSPLLWSSSLPINRLKLSPFTGQRGLSLRMPSSM